MSAQPPVGGVPLEMLERLLEEAKRVQGNAYAPYSSYLVGAAVLADNGKVYRGCNVENASYGLALCAERSAVAQAVADGAKRLVAAALITASSPPATPCGLCRQTFAEFARDLPILMANDKGERILTNIEELLPRAFRRDDLT